MNQTPRLMVIALLLLQLSFSPVIARQAAAPAQAKPQTLAELQTRIAALLDQPQFALQVIKRNIISDGKRRHDEEQGEDDQDSKAAPGVAPSPRRNGRGKTGWTGNSHGFSRFRAAA